jgi:hypothetical protein
MFLVNVFQHNREREEELLHYVYSVTFVLIPFLIIRSFHIEHKMNTQWGGRLSVRMQILSLEILIEYQ